MKFGEKSLKGIHVNIYQGNRGDWFADVLLSKKVFPGTIDAPLPMRGNRPMTDNSSHRWWYDMSVGLKSYNKHHPNFFKDDNPRKSSQALTTLWFNVADLVSEIVPDKSEGKILAAVMDLPVTAHSRWR